MIILLLLLVAQASPLKNARHIALLSQSCADLAFACLTACKATADYFYSMSCHNITASSAEEPSHKIIVVLKRGEHFMT